jgi:hypothetical protein
MTIRTPVPAAQIKVVQFGTLYVQADGRELPATTCRVVCLPEEAIYAFSREDSVSDLGRQQGIGKAIALPMAVRGQCGA